jgi:AcrR family transcriptional regulator
VIDPILFQSFDLQLSKGDQRRFQIIEAAIECLGREGVQAANLEQVAKRLKTRRSHVTYYFKDWEDLLEAAIKYVIASAQRETIQKIGSASAPEQKILGMVEGAFVWAKKYPDQAAVYLYFHYACATEPRFRNLNAEIRGAGLRRLRALLAEMPGARHLPDSDRDEAARSLHCLMSAFLLEHLTVEGPGVRSKWLPFARGSVLAWLERAFNPRKV